MNDSTGSLSRRNLLVRSGICLGAAALAPHAAAASAGQAKEGVPFGYCLNTGTIMGHKLPITAEVDVAAEAGYQGIEPWLRNLQQYVDERRPLADLRKRIEDRGLRVESAIGFARWAVDDEAERAAGVEQLRREMDMIAQIGGKRIAAPPAGINKIPGMDLRVIAERYREVLEVGRRMSVVPQLEIWGSALTLGRAGEAAMVAVQADHPDACLLLDAFHMYKGGSGFEGLRLLNGGAMHAFHINDYPAGPPRETITDADRIYPGDGVCPLGLILRTLRDTGFRGALSLELFNRGYWERHDALTVARTGLEKTRAVVAAALE